ncbi:MAG: hypothetical protein M1825_000727 [Sarcosagium campestre]|nr:MAG: hypothetical protein M1825_000727 [Sarcosagium campestre]
MHLSNNIGSALTVGAALLCATPAVAQPHQGPRHVHRREAAQVYAPAPAPVYAPAPAPAPVYVPAPAPAPVVAPAPVYAPAAPVKPAAKVHKPAAPKKSKGPVKSTTSGGKRGLVYNDASRTTPFLGGKAASWAYNWESLPNGLSPEVEYVPMLHGPFDRFTANWKVNAPACIAKGSKHLLAFNEPDFETGEDYYISPSDAASSYKTYMHPYKSQVKLGAPSVTSQQAPGKGLEWLKSFLSACSDCQIDFIPIHWYGQPEQAQMFKDHVAAAGKLGGNKPIWITEFQAFGSSDQQATFIADVLPWLDSQPYVERYSYFKVDDALTSGSSKSPAGSAYASS